MWYFWGPLFVLVFLGIGSLLVMLLWNALLPDIFGIKAINYLQAAGVLILSKILIGPFGRGRRHFGHRHWPKKDECACESTPAEEKKA